MTELSAPHRSELEKESAIKPEVIHEYGFATIGKKEAATYGFKGVQQKSGLLMVFQDVHGTECYQLKPDDPRVNRSGKPIKYESPRGQRPVIAMSARSRAHIGDPDIPLMITEGVKKMASAESHGVQCIIGVQGVYNFRGRNESGGITALPDWEHIALNGRDVLLAFDGDVVTKPQVQKALLRIKRLIEGRGGIVTVLTMPDLDDGSKCGLDDWFASGGTLEDLRQFVQDNVPVPVIERGDEPPFSDETYRAKPDGFYRAAVDDEGNERLVRMTDFTAWIVAQTTHPERPDLNYVEVLLRDRSGKHHGPVRILDSEFRQVDGRNGWLGKFGSTFRVFAGATNAHLVNAVQVAGGDVPVVTVFDRLGWMKDAAGEWHYLTAAGAFGANDLDTSIRVEPGGRLSEYQLQDSSDTEAVKAAVRHVLELQGIAQTDQGVAAVIVSMASMLRSLLIPARRQNFTTTIVGETGSGKSALAGIALQMFGPAFGYDHLTDNWGSTLNSLLDNASRARHAPLVVDDYVEIDTGTAGIGRQAQSRDTLIRLVANSAPRNRLKADTSRNDGAEPETGLISTQETTGSFRHASEAARQIFVRLEKRSDDGADLSIDAVKQRSRDHGRTGTYNLAISGYVQSLAAGMDALHERIDSLHDAAMDMLSKRTVGLGLHERTLPALADLAIGWDTFISYALRTGAIDKTEAEHHRETCTLALIRIAQDQAMEQDAERPELLIVELLQELFSSRQATLRDRLTDEVPDSPTQMGWRSQTRETYSGHETQHNPSGKEIGWVDSEFVYLIPKATAQALQSIARDSRIVLPAGEKQLGAVLVRSGVALPGEAGKHTKPIEVGSLSESGGGRRRAIRIPRITIFPEAIALTNTSDSNVTELRRVVA